MSQETTPAVITPQDLIRFYLAGTGGILDITMAKDRHDLDEEEAADLALSLITYTVFAMPDQTVRDLTVDINLLLRKLRLPEVTEQVVLTVAVEVYTEEHPTRSA